MIKGFTRALAPFAALAVLVGVTLAGASPASAATLHGCADANFCIYVNGNYGTPMTGFASGTIYAAPGHCWQFAAGTFNNSVSSYVMNFAGVSTLTAHFYDNNVCSGTHFDEPNPPQAHASMPSGWNDRVGSISLTQ